MNNAQLSFIDQKEWTNNVVILCHSQLFLQCIIFCKIKTVSITQVVSLLAIQNNNSSWNLKNDHVQAPFRNKLNLG